MKTVCERPSGCIPKRGYAISEICSSLGVSKGVVIGEIKNGKLVAKRVGNRRLIVMAEDLATYLERADA